MTSQKVKQSKSINILGITNDSRVLVIYPHADDETMSCGGLLQKLGKNHIDYKVVILTKGEATTNKFGLSENSDLVKTRELEFINAMKILGVKNHSVHDFPDSKLEAYEKELFSFIKDILVNEKYNVVITYEPCGIYGHPDHIALTKVIENVIQQIDIPVRLIYTTVPKSFKSSKDSLKMAKDPEKVKPIEANSIILLTPLEYLVKLKAIMSYKSQFNLSITHIFLWFLYSHLTSKEYFYVK